MKIPSFSLLRKAVIATLCALLPIAISFTYGYYEVRDHLKRQTLDDLTVMVEAYEGQVYQFIEMSRRRAQDFAASGSVANHTAEAASGDRAAARRLSEHLVKYKLPLDKAIDRISVISPSGKVVASTNTSFIGQDVSKEEFFKGGLKGFAAYEISAEAGAPEIAVSGPVIDRDSGMTVGVLVNFLHLSDISSVLTGEFNRELGAISWSKGRRTTMETYLVNKDKSLITESKFIKDAVYKVKVDTPPVKECLSHGREMADFYTDYRGVDVAGASMCIPSMGWTLITEINAEEVRAPAAEILNSALAGAGVAAGIIALLFAAFYRIVLFPLKALANASESIAAGSFDVRVPVRSGDEIGVLAETFNAMARDLSERTRLLKQSEERLRTIIDNSTAMIFMKDASGRYVIANRSFSSLVPISEEIAGKTDHDLFDGEIADMFCKNDSVVLSRKSPMEFEERLRINGSHRYYISVRVPLLDGNGEPYALCGISTDITERKVAEENIRRLSRLYSVLSKINEAIVRVRDAGALYDASCRVLVEDGGFALAWVGAVMPETGEITSVAASGQTAYIEGIKVRVSGPGEAPEGRGPSGTAIKEGRFVACDDIGTDPRMAPWRERALEFGFGSSVSFPLFLEGRPVAVLNIYSREKGFFKGEELSLLEALAADIAFAVETMELERQRKRSDDELKLMLAISLAIKDAGDINSAFRVVLERICQVTGWRLAEVWTPAPDGATLEYAASWCDDAAGLEPFINASKMISFTMGVGLPGKVWERVEPEWVRDFSNGRAYPRAELAIMVGLKSAFATPIVWGGKVLAVLAFYMPEARDEDKRLVEIVTAISAHLGSVIGRKLSEEARQEIQERYEELVNNISAGLFRSAGGENGLFIEANRAFIDMFEAGEREAIVRCRTIDLFADREEGLRLLKSLDANGVLKAAEAELVTLRGKRFWGAISAILKKDPSGVEFVDGMVEEITERKRLEEQLRHSQKMEAVGQLAGGIAHDFNNILTAIIGYGNLLSMKRAEDGLVKSYTEHILSLSDKAAKLTQGLLAFSRKQIMNPQPTDLNDLIKRISKILSRLIGEDIEIRLKLKETPLTVKADSTMIEQVLMNLATNARDAMPRGGSLSIATDLVFEGKDFGEKGSAMPGEYARIVFTDTGTGMDAETAKRIFEPFFTTKEVGKGTGLGLSMVYGIIKQHGGYIDVESEPGRGASFKIYLPIAEESTVEAMSAPEAELKGGRETVLLAEDEPDVREITRAMLEEFGYRVIEASNGLEAVERFKEHAEEIDLLVFDLIMPRMNGKEAYEEIKKMKPGIRHIFSSGYATDTMRARGLADEAANLITKPVSPKDFLRKIREVLEK